MKRLTLALAFITGIFLAGCTTPEIRIRQNPAAFDRATPTQQDLIKQGKVDIGFNEELVELALGVPDRTRERIDEKGKELIWSYVNYESDDGDTLYRGWYHRSLWGGPQYPYFADYPSRRESEHFRVVFRDGKVVEIEHET